MDAISLFSHSISYSFGEWETVKGVAAGLFFFFFIPDPDHNNFPLHIFLWLVGIKEKKKRRKEALRAHSLTVARPLGTYSMSRDYIPGHSVSVTRVCAHFLDSPQSGARSACPGNDCERFPILLSLLMATVWMRELGHEKEEWPFTDFSFNSFSYSQAMVSYFLCGLAGKIRMKEKYASRTNWAQ